MHDVSKPHRITRLDTASFHGLTKFITRALLAASKRLDQDLVRSSKRSLIQLGFAVVVTTDRINARSCQHDQPTNVICYYEMPGRTHDMQAKNKPVVNRLLDNRLSCIQHALTYSPLRAGIVLCLNCNQRFHHIDPTGHHRSRKMLLGQTYVSDVG